MSEIDFRYDLLPLKDMLFRLAYRITLDRAEAEDIVEDTLIRVWEQRQEIEVENLEAYCYRICKNMSLDKTKLKAAQNLSLDATTYDTPNGELSPLEKLEAKENRTMIARLINQLPEPQRDIIQLREIEGLTYKEIAERLKLTESNVKVLLHRTRQLLKVHLLKTGNYGL